MILHLFTIGKKKSIYGPYDFFITILGFETKKGLKALFHYSNLYNGIDSSTESIGFLFFF